MYLDGIPRAWREEHVKKHLKEFGRIVKVELARHIPSAIRTNYCYVTFETHEAAATCVNGVNVDGLYFRDKRVRQLLFTVSSMSVTLHGFLGRVLCHGYFHLNKTSCLFQV